MDVLVMILIGVIACYPLQPVGFALIPFGFISISLMLIFWVITGPFKINGVPLRRVNQAYVIATSTKVDISKVNVEKFDDKYFAKEVQKKKKGEGEFFEAEKEVSLMLCSHIFISTGRSIVFFGLLNPILIFYLLTNCRKRRISRRRRKMTRRLLMLHWLHPLREFPSWRYTWLQDFLSSQAWNLMSLSSKGTSQLVGYMLCSGICLI